MLYQTGNTLRAVDVFRRLLLACLFLCSYSALPPGQVAYAVDPPRAVHFQLPIKDHAWIVGRSFGEFIKPPPAPDYFWGRHLANDVGARAGVTAGTPIYPMSEGIVRYAKDLGIGYTVVIEHRLSDGKRFCSVYYHLLPPSSAECTPCNGIRLNVGDLVSPDMAIGVVSGRPVDHGESSPHLHFGIRKNAYDGGCDRRTEKWFYPGYTSIFRCGPINGEIPCPCQDEKARQKNEQDVTHQRVADGWESDPKKFIESLQPAQNSCPGFALQFDGSDDEVLIPDSPSLHFAPGNPMTVECWFNPRTDGGHILGRRTSCFANMNYQISYADGVFDFFSPGSTRVREYYVPPLNQWTHVAGTYDGATSHLYINGVERGTSSGSPAINDGSPLRFGASADCARFAGQIDEVRVWNVARSFEEINANLHRTVDPSTPGLVGYWNFDEETTNQSVLDRSPFHNNGTLGASADPGSDDPIREASTAPICAVAKTASAALEVSRSAEPQTAELGSNNPNPFNSSTAIAFDLPEAGHVELNIYDMLGRRVATLVDNQLEAGRHRVQWNGRDSHGHELASGLYIYQLVTAKQRVSKKMVLLK